MEIGAFLIGLLLLGIVLWDTFETIVLPRSVTRKIRLARLFYFTFWKIYTSTALRLCRANRRETYLSAFGPLSLLLLFVVWALCLILSFALIQYGLGSRTISPLTPPGFRTDLYMSGTTFFTLGLGDVTPNTNLARAVAVIEAGVGFGFLAIVIGYLPVLYQSFSRREVGISLLDARAGSPPSAGELLRRHGQAQSMDALTSLLQSFEQWSADLLESHLSYPVLAYYRSQHDRESWLFALTAILDACALIGLRFEGAPEWERSLVWQAHLTFAMARHAVVDLALVFNATPYEPAEDRLPAESLAQMRASLSAAGIPLRKDKAAEVQFAAMRRQYEPYVNALARRMLLSLPPWLAETEAADNWQTSAWTHEDHFESRNTNPTKKG
jgi:hypothetical protein